QSGFRWTQSRAARTAVVLRPLRRDRRRGGGGDGNACTRRRGGGTRRARAHHHQDNNEERQPTKDQSPQVNLRDGSNRARAGAISSTRPCIATPRLGPIASTTIAAR